MILVASSQKDTLFRFHMNQHFRADNGRPGMGRNRTGASGEHTVIKLPVGTMVHDVETGLLLTDLAEPGYEYIIARGGRGGQGNARFATSTNKAPKFAQPGEPGEELRIRLELKLLADVGLVGLPNVGKSTLISRLSAARPKIAEYPFTTLIPNLGVVAVDDEHSFVLADIPGLIEGASQGAGLGHRFLRHIQRCRVLLHLLDAGETDPDSPLSELSKINEELTAFDPSLSEKRQLVAVSKMDLTGAEQVAEAVRRALPGQSVLAFSAVTGEGLNELKWALWEALLEAADVVDSDELDAGDDFGPL